MFISDTDNDRAINSRTAIIYLSCTAFCGFFSSVYGKFSHGVSSNYMVFLCLIPFLLGVIPYTLLFCFKLKAPNPMERYSFNCGVATLSVGSCLAGIFEIYGSKCIYVPFYFYVGAALIIVSSVLFIVKR